MLEKGGVLELDIYHIFFFIPSLNTKGVFDVSRTTKILRRPGPKCHSMSRGRRRF